MVAIRTLAAPTVAVGARPVVPAPAPVLTRGAIRPLAYTGTILTTAKTGQTVLALPTRAVRYYGSAYANYYERIYIIPAALTLVNPIAGQPNSFFVWNTYLASQQISAVTGTNTSGMALSLTVGNVLPSFSLVSANIIVSSAVATSRDANFKLDFTSGALANIPVAVIVTNMIRTYPETPVTEKWAWSTNIISVRNGREQRIGLRQNPLITLSLDYNFGFEDTEFETYSRLLSASTSFTIPLYHEPMLLSAPLVEGATQIAVDPTEYDVKEGDQLMVVEGDAYDILTVSVIASGVVYLGSPPSRDYSASARAYRVALADRPSTLSLSRAPYNDLSGKFDLSLANSRSIFSSTVAGEEADVDTAIPERVLTRTVYTLQGIPIANARPIVDGSYSEDFDPQFEAIGTDYGKKTYLTDLVEAKTSYNRRFFLKNATSRHHFARILAYMHGRRRPLWLPTWQNEIGGFVQAVSGASLVLSGPAVAKAFAADRSHIGLWMEFNGRYLPRRIISISVNATGDTSIVLDKTLPSDYYLKTSFDISFMVLTRLASDEVSFTHYGNYSMLDMGLVTIRDGSDLS